MSRIRRRYRQGIVWVAAFTGCVVFSGALLLGLIFALKDNAAARAELENSYKKSFFELADSLDAMEVEVSKMMVSASEEQTVLLAAEVGRQAQIAMYALEQLPASSSTACELNRFLAQIGDWCDCYGHTILECGEFCEFEDSIEQVFDCLRSVNAEIRDIASDFAAPNYSISQNLSKKGIKSAGKFALLYDSLNNASLSYPKLVYDGEFSDKTEGKCYRGLEGLAEVSEAHAQQVFVEIFSPMGLKNVEFVGMTSEPCAYEFRGDLQGGTIYVSISKQGGKLLSANSDLYSNIIGQELSEKNIDSLDNKGDAQEDSISNSSDNFQQGTNDSIEKNAEAKSDSNSQNTRIKTDPQDESFRAYINENHNLDANATPSVSSKEMRGVGVDSVTQDNSSPATKKANADSKNNGNSPFGVRKKVNIDSATDDTNSNNTTTNSSRFDLDFWENVQGIDRVLAQEIAVYYAELCGYSCQLVPVWYNNVGRAAYVSLAPQIDGIIHYPDMVKVKVSLDDAKLLAFEANGFCQNNCKRELSPAIDASAAKGLVSPKLSVRDCRLVCISIDRAEKLCYEISASFKDMDYIIYIDAITGRQARIQRVISDFAGEMLF